MHAIDGNLGPQLLPCNSPELEKKAHKATIDSAADRFNEMGHPELAVLARKFTEPWELHDSTDEDDNAIVREILRKEIDESNMKICISKNKSQLVVEYIEGFKVHGIMVTGGKPGPRF